jgi:hypothetical protein
MLDSNRGKLIKPSEAGDVPSIFQGRAFLLTKLSGVFKSPTIRETAHNRQREGKDIGGSFKVAKIERRISRLHRQE